MSFASIYSSYIHTYWISIGLSLGVISIIAPILLAEICQERYRGVITTVHEVFVALGLFSSIFFGKLFLTYVDHGWQYIQVSI